MISESGVPYKIISGIWRHLPFAIRQPIQKLVIRGDYQKIRFRRKTFVEGRYRAKSYEQLFPTSPFGKSILDVGCNFGYYSLMALQEGAKYCRAVDIDEGCITKLREVATEFGFRNLDVVKSDIVSCLINEDFDIVLCLNLIHHFETIKQVEMVLDNLYNHTREQLILIVLAPDNLDKPFTRDEEIDPMGGKRFLRISPSWFIGRYDQAHVEVLNAVTYGRNRRTIIITKTPADSKQATSIYQL